MTSQQLCCDVTTRNILGDAAAQEGDQAFAKELSGRFRSAVLVGLDTGGCILICF